MDLRGNIKRILREESNKDLTPIIQTLLDGSVYDHKDVLCKVEVKHPDKRTKLPHSDNNYENYRATFYLIAHKGGYSGTRAQLIDNVMNEVWDLVYNYTGQKLDMFTKYVNSCDDIIRENKENSIPNMVKTLGITDAIKYFGNYYNIEPYLKVADKVNFIKEKVSELGRGGISLREIGEEPIFYEEDGDDHKQIEYLGRDRAYVDIYYRGHNVGDEKIPYESLSVEIIELLVEILLNH